MSLNEFSLIKQYFEDTGKSLFPPILSLGDDAAVVEIPHARQLVMSIDTLIEGVHFPVNTSATDIAYKSLAVNLSDLAAMGATPAWFLLSLSLPGYDEPWLAEFSDSLKAMASDFNIELIGGDTCQGPLSITVQVNGLVPENKFVTRSGAQPGDSIVVSGILGNAALGLSCLTKKINLPEPLKSQCLLALNRPKPRLELSEFLLNYATAAIDLSDGLVGDLRHILNKSQAGAIIRQKDLPVNNWIRSQNAYDYVLKGGDDYELCFTIKASQLPKVLDWNRENPHCQLSVIGEITDTGFKLQANNALIDLTSHRGYQHFE